MHLAPIFIHRALQTRDLRQLRQLHPDDCTECGCCSYLCPAHIPLVNSVRSACKALDEEVSP
jgi:electron transport complex protein RnfC